MPIRRATREIAGAFPRASDPGQTLDCTLQDEDSTAEFERLQDKMALAQAISHMEPLWQKIVLLRYYREQTQEEVAAVLGLSQVKVSREEKKIFAFLRQQLA